MINQQAHLEGKQHNIKSIGILMVDTAMQQKIRESGINHVSKVKKSDLISTVLPAELSLWLHLTMQMIYQENDFSQRADINDRFEKWKKIYIHK